MCEIAIHILVRRPNYSLADDFRVNDLMTDTGTGSRNESLVSAEDAYKSHDSDFGTPTMPNANNDESASSTGFSESIIGQFPSVLSGTFATASDNCGSIMNMDATANNIDDNVNETVNNDSDQKNETQNSGARIKSLRFASDVVTNVILMDPSDNASKIALKRNRQSEILTRPANPEISQKRRIFSQRFATPSSE